jgi:hypothetical protein
LIIEIDIDGGEQLREIHGSADLLENLCASKYATQCRSISQLASFNTL